MVWYEQPVRMMRWDYLDNIQQMRDIDLDALAKLKKEQWHINCEWIIGTPGISPGLGYYVTFNTPKFEKYPALGEFDLIRSYLPYAKKYGIHVLAYLNMHWFSYEFAARHPGWEQILADGTSYGKRNPLYGSGTTFCVNSAWRDWAFDIIAETMRTGVDGVFLDGPVIFPDCCHCPTCATKFEAQYHAKLPVQQDWFNPVWKQFIEFREQSLADYLRDARAAVKQINPAGIIFLNAGNWYSGAWRIARDVEKVGPYQDFNGAEAFFHPGTPDPQLFFWSLLAKYLHATKKPTVVFNHHCLGSWHYIPLPEMEMQLATAQTVANGANPWIAVFQYALNHSYQSALNPVNELFGFLEKNEEYYTETESTAEIAILLSRQTSTYYLSQLEEMYVDAGTGKEEGLVADIAAKKTIDWSKRKEISDRLVGNAFLGWSTALLRSHIPFEVILDTDLETMPQYRVIILPNSACLTDKQIAGIEQYVKRGGSIIATYETGMYDEQGNKREINPLWSLFGIKKIDRVLSPSFGEEYLKVKSTSSPVASFRINQFISRPAYSLFIQQADGVTAPITFMNPIGKLYHPPQGESKYPALLISSFGKGKVLYFPHSIDETYARLKIAEHWQLMTDSVTYAYGEDMMLETDAPSTVEIEIKKQRNPNRLLIHLVNNTGDMQRPMNMIIPIHNIHIKLHIPKPNKVYSIKTKQEIPFEILKDGIQFIIDTLYIYEVIAIDS